MQQVIDRIEVLVCELHYEAGDTKDRARAATYYIVVALLEKAVSILRATLG